MMKRLFAGRFIRSIGYLLSVHLVALLFFFGLRVALFIATDYDFPKEISEDYALQSVAFLRGLWFDNVIACYILLLPLAVFWIAGWFGYTARWLYRSSAFFFIFFYSLCFIISAANIPYFAYFFKPINSSIFNWFDFSVNPKTTDEIRLSYVGSEMCIRARHGTLPRSGQRRSGT